MSRVHQCFASVWERGEKDREVGEKMEFANERPLECGGENTVRVCVCVEQS